MYRALRREIDTILRNQHSTICGEQARRAGLSQAQICRLATTGEWDRVHRGVYRTASSVPTFEQRLMAACLAGGPTAVVSHESAAWIWQLLASPPSRPTISVPISVHPRLSGVD